MPKAPRTHIVYRCYDASGWLLYIGLTNSLTQRKWHHRQNSFWWPQLFWMTTEEHPDRESGTYAERMAILNEDPLYNVVRHLPPIPWETPCPR